MAKITAKDSKLMNTVRRAFEKSKADVTFSELLQVSRLDSVSLTNALTLLKATQENGYWYLPKVTPSGETIISMPAPNEETVERPVIHPGSSGVLINPNTGREYIELPETGKTIKQAILEQIAEDAEKLQEIVETTPDFELQPPPINQKHFLLIENCYLSLAQDGTGQEPALAEIGWFDDEGEALEEDDCKVLDRAAGVFSNSVDFRGVTYNRLFVNSAQLFHGLFDDIQIANARLDELAEKKPRNHFEVIEV